MRLSLTAANRASIVILAGLVAGCSSTSPGTQALPPGSPGATQPVARPRSTTDNAVQFAYVVDLGSNDVSAYSIGASGALTPLAGSPFKAGTGPDGLAIDPPASSPTSTTLAPIMFPLTRSMRPAAR